MTDIPINNRNLVYSIQALRFWIADLAQDYQGLDLDNCDESDKMLFLNHQEFLYDIFKTYDDLMSDYEDAYDDKSNMTNPEELELKDETIGMLETFFPEMSED